MNIKQKGKIIIPAGRNLWPHELSVAIILANNGYSVEFLQEQSLKNADILLNGIKFEIKSPETDKVSSVEQLLRKAVKQSPNIIISSQRIKMRDNRLKGYLINKCRTQKKIKRMLLITKSGKIIDIFKLI